MGRSVLRLGGCRAQWIRMLRLIFRVAADWASSPLSSMYLDGGCGCCCCCGCGC